MARTFLNPAEIARQLNGATSREQGHEIIADLTVTQLRTLCHWLAIPRPARKQDLRNMIVNLRVGRRIDSLALERHAR